MHKQEQKERTSSQIEFARAVEKSNDEDGIEKPQKKI